MSLVCAPRSLMNTPLCTHHQLRDTDASGGSHRFGGGAGALHPGVHQTTLPKLGGRCHHPLSSLYPRVSSCFLVETALSWAVGRSTASSPRRTRWPTRTAGIRRRLDRETTGECDVPDVLPGTDARAGGTWRQDGGSKIHAHLTPQQSGTAGPDGLAIESDTADKLPQPAQNGICAGLVSIFFLDLRFS